MDFNGKVVLVTGASRGIGKATALLFGQKGANVVINYSKNKEKANEVVEEIKKLGQKAISIQCDVSKEDEVKSMIDQTVKEFGKIDILVNNAGIVYEGPPLKKTTEEWRHTFDVNLMGTVFCSKYCAEHMLKQKSGKIINISSINGLDKLSPWVIEYCASKSAVINFTRNLAKELAPDIQVNSVAPGWTKTDMNDDLPKDFFEEEIEKIYLKRFAEPYEIGNAVLFLASDYASYITGETLRVDGGY